MILFEKNNVMQNSWSCVLQVSDLQMYIFQVSDVQLYIFQVFQTCSSNNVLDTDVINPTCRRRRSVDADRGGAG